MFHQKLETGSILRYIFLSPCTCGENEERNFHYGLDRKHHSWSPGAAASAGAAVPEDGGRDLGSSSGSALGQDPGCWRSSAACPTSTPETSLQSILEMVRECIWCIWAKYIMQIWRRKAYMLLRYTTCSYILRYIYVHLYMYVHIYSAYELFMKVNTLVLHTFFLLLWNMHKCCWFEPLGLSRNRNQLMLAFPASLRSSVTKKKSLLILC